MTGIQTIAAADYHADPCDQPSLSASIIHLLCTQSPAHAKQAHPRLSPDYQRAEEDRFDLGTAAHALLLEGDAGVHVVDANDWRTNAAKEERDAARTDGKTPLLAKHWAEMQLMVAAARDQLAHVEAIPALFQDGQPEQTLIWEDHGVHCRARLDWLHNDQRTIDDYKTTAASANPEKWQRTMYGIGADTQAAFYMRGLEAVTGARPEFRFVVQETFPPYALSVIALAPSALALSDEKIGWALRTWKGCLESGRWPGYSSRVAHVELPAWEEMRWLEREGREAA